MKLIPILIIFLPFCLIVSRGFRSSDKPFWKSLKTALWLIIWLYVLLCLGVIQNFPNVTKFIIGIIAFALPLFLVWKSSALHWFGHYTQRAQWSFSAGWIAIWYLLFDRTGLGLITWVAVWPTVIFMLWKSYAVNKSSSKALLGVPGNNS
jgi:hypothetical protein